MDDDDDVPQLPIRRMRNMSEDADWMLKGIDTRAPYIAINAALSDDEAREAERDAREAYKRDQRRRRGILALPLLGVDRVKRGAREHPAGAAATTAALGIAGLLAAVAVLLPHGHGPSGPHFARPPAPHPSTTGKPPAHEHPSHPGTPPHTGRPQVPPLAGPGHTAVPVAHRPVTSHPGHHSPRPPRPGQPPTRSPAPPPVTRPLPVGLHLNVLGIVCVDLGAGMPHVGVPCHRSR